MRTRVESLRDVKSLNLWGNEICDVSLLAEMPNVEILSLSMNKIRTLAPFASCAKLTELYLRKNEVGDLSEVNYISGLRKLRVLWLCDNPCAQRADYRLSVIRALPSLTKLDNEDITEAERVNAASAAPIPRVSPQNDEAARAPAPLKRESSQRSAKADNGPSPQPSAVSQPAAQRGAAASGGGGGNNSNNSNNNIMYAILALMNELDVDDLAVVRSEADQRMQALRSRK